LPAAPNGDNSPIVDIDHQFNARGSKPTRPDLSEFVVVGWAHVIRIVICQPDHLDRYVLTARFTPSVADQQLSTKRLHRIPSHGEG
jgi:hypothetical protein